MKRKIACVLTLVAFVLVSLGSIAVAQDEITLESLNARLQAVEAALADFTPGLGTRVEALEAKFADPWSPDVIYMDDSVCQNPLHAKRERGDFIQMEIRQETADAYRTQYGTSIDPSGNVYLSSISFDVDSSDVYIQYTINNRTVVEKWAHCEFLGHSEWE